ncbi:hypothetical protein MmiHf6_06300 [Methanimicrococcus hongohii]|uniref:Uncharacterized protein n=1 Tax=Methanimicrococcus hongohii TaxID=3028295 RepID=A0AA96V130_9EURY|nr:hypothetical protein MmiHf6_06300 [Methanimicrococcus sp. Hf6]
MLLPAIGLRFRVVSGFRFHCLCSFYSNPFAFANVPRLPSGFCFRLQSGLHRSCRCRHRSSCPPPPTREPLRFSLIISKKCSHFSLIQKKRSRFSLIISKKRSHFSLIISKKRSRFSLIISKNAPVFISQSKQSAISSSINLFLTIANPFLSCLRPHL